MDRPVTPEGRVRVLHVIQNLAYGGMEKLLADLVRGFSPERVETHILVLQFLGRFAEGLDERATLHEAEPMSPWSMLRPVALAERMRAIAPDVVHTHSGVWYKASLAARIAGVPRLVHTDHGRPPTEPWPDRFVDRLASRRTDAVVAVSEALGEYLVARRIVADPTRLHVIRNGVDCDRFRPGAGEPRLPRELGLDPGQPIVGSIGRLEPVKGYDRLVRAFACLVADRGVRPTPALVLAGDGSQREGLESLARELGVAEAVHLLGWRDDIHALHGAFSLFAMSSFSEGTSVSLLEAMASGLCPVVTDVGGNRAVLGPELAHRLVPSGEPDVLAQALRNALRDAERRDRDGAAARRRVKERFSLRATIAAYEQLYRA